MKYAIFLTIFLLASITLCSQTLGINQGKTYAVVVGISDYQDEAIPDLRFADKDAEAFAHYLRSPAGGNLDDDHLHVLTNGQATAGNIAAALYWLVDESKENDKVIIYFSGHGDVEAKFRGQPGFLLCWDAPPQVYMAGGTIQLGLLQTVISTLSLDNKAKVTIITDACRSGKLAGSNNNGSQLTNANLSQQYANEIKILSCQPDEFSIEGEQWGGGRGAFSYHLLDGLYGMADSDENLNVDLKEISRYLEDKVSGEVAPQSQNPMTVGSRTEKLANVFPELLHQLKVGKKGQLQLFTSTESKGIEDDVMAQVDSNIVEMYWAFKESLEDKQFLKPANACADFYYEQLSQEPQLKKLHSSMRRNYAAALQDDAQQVMNRLLKSDPWEANKSQKVKNKNYGQYPTLLRRAAQLLGNQHYMHDILMARSYWFEGYLKDDSNCSCENIPNALKVIPYYKKALQYQPDMPHAHLQLSAVFGTQMLQGDSAQYYADLALKNVPNWTMAYDWVANSYLKMADKWHLSQDQKDQYMVKAKEWLERGIASDSNSILLLNNLGYWYSLNGEFAKEQLAYDRALAVDTTATTLDYKAIGYYWWGKYEAAEKAWLASFKREPENLGTSPILEMYYLLGQDKKAKKLLREVLATNYNDADFYKNVARKVNIYYPEESIELFKRSIALRPLDAAGCNAFSHCYAYLQPQDFEGYLKYKKKAIELDPTNHLFHNNVGNYHLSQQEWNKAEQKFLEARSLNSTHPRTNAGLYLLYTLMDQPEKAKKELLAGMQLDAEQMLSKISGIAAYAIPDSVNEYQFFQPIESTFSTDPVVHYYYAQYLSFAKQDAIGGFVQLEKALKKGYQNYSRIVMDPLFRNLVAKREKWNTLLNKYFPEQFKK